jgi:glycine cleavage system H protein
MINYLEYKIDKFIFRVADDRYYTDDGLWVKPENNHLRIGISDYLQQRSGDVAFAEVKPEGTLLSIGDELVVIETIKVNISLVSPVTGTVLEVNPILDTTPEAINQDPYGTGWLAVMETEEELHSIRHLLVPLTYFSKIKKDAEQEVNKNE